MAYKIATAKDCYDILGEQVTGDFYKKGITVQEFVDNFENDNKLNYNHPYIMELMDENRLIMKDYIELPKYYLTLDFTEVPMVSTGSYYFRWGSGTYLSVGGFSTAAGATYRYEIKDDFITAAFDETSDPRVKNMIVTYNYRTFTIESSLNGSNQINIGQCLQGMDSTIKIKITLI